MITALGWLGTALVIASYAQPNVARLRRISLIASAVLIAFNAALGIWSNVALEVALVVINLERLRRDQTEAARDMPDLERREVDPYADGHRRSANAQALHR
ncbi:hypothetical protein [Aeromicrobium sp.]|uniref:hypothetical protein n=1 Tax=Aeromicrobium sp. TaxID=1871063 RepID=UPI002FCA22E1